MIDSESKYTRLYNSSEIFKINYLFVKLLEKTNQLNCRFKTVINFMNKNKYFKSIKIAYQIFLLRSYSYKIVYIIQESNLP